MCLALLALLGASELQAATIAARGSHTLEIRGGKLYAWGGNSRGQLGDGSVTSRLSPVQVSLPAGVSPTAVAAGGDSFFNGYSLAIGSNGKLYAWGYNAFGQLGDGSTTQRLSPVQVSLPAGITPTAVAAGQDHSLAIGSDGKVYAWGNNFFGQLGDGSRAQRLSPVQVSLPGGVTPTAVAAGSAHSLAIGSDGKLYAWGFNSEGQLGDGSINQRLSPVQVSLPAGVTTAVTAGSGHSLAISSDGKLYAWGRNDNGQLGDGSTANRLSPVQVSLPAGVTPTDVAAGYAHSLAIGSDGRLYAWGWNNLGQLGDGSATQRTIPVQVNLPAFVRPTALAAGDYHSMAIGSDGKLYTWGYNSVGQLGDGSTNQRSSPVQVSLPASVAPTAVTAGGGHSLAIGSDGRLYAWGNNLFGQLGDGSTTQRLGPGQVNLPSGVAPTAVAAGDAHSLAIGSDGKLYAWGDNSEGQLGDGSDASRLSPVQVSLPANVAPVSVAAGPFHSMAIGSDGKLYAWGYNGDGQLGDGPSRLNPVQVSLPADVTPTAVATGSSHSLAVGSDGKLYAWGSNDFGQLGDGTVSFRLSPVQVSLPAGVTPTAVAAGELYSLAIGSDGKLYAWGSNFDGQLGDGSTTYRLNPVQVGLPAGVAPASVAAGLRHSLAIGTDSKLYAWGYNSDGQLGDGSTTQRLSPVQVSLPTSVTPTAVAAGFQHSLAIGSDGKLYAWGYNFFGQLGDGTGAYRSSPVTVNRYPGTTLSTTPNPSIAGQAVLLTATVSGDAPTGTVQFKDGTNNLGVPVTLAAGQAQYRTTALSLGAHAITAAHSGDTRNGGSVSAAVTQVVQQAATIAAGGAHTLEIRGGKLYAWGSNSFGQLGDGSPFNRPSPVQVSLPAGVTPTAVAAGQYHSLAIGSDGKLYAWGYNFFGQLGDGSTIARQSPVQVSLPAGVTPTAVAAGLHHSLAIGADGKLYAWGWNVIGQLGDGSTTDRSSPGQVSLPAGVTPTAVAAGVHHSLAIGADGKLYAWGYNFYGQLGDGSTTDRSSPGQVSLPAGVTPTAVEAGVHHSVAIGADGKLYAWGRNGNGQLGDGSTTDRHSPVQVSLPAGVSPTAVAAGQDHSLAIGSDGKLYAWGLNTDGQLGDGSNNNLNHPIPVQVSLLAGVTPTAVAAGNVHSLTIGSDGKLYAWGFNFNGELGDGSTTRRLSPVTVNSYPLPSTVTALITAPNPSVAGQAVTLTATVTGDVPTGTVQFMDGANNLGLPVTLAAGQAQYSTTALSLGTHAITAAYSGDASNAASVSAVVNQVVSQAVSSATLSVNPPAPTEGETVTLTATVIGFSPGGSVQFKDGATDLGATVAVSNGTATLSTNALTAGIHSVTAVYSGDVNNTASTSAVAPVTVAAGNGGGSGDIPTLPQWGLILLGMSLLIQGWRHTVR